MVQLTPKVSRADVERVLRRDFPSNLLSDVLQILDEYGTEEHHREKERVQLAVLKLSAGSQERLRREIQETKCDYRDVLSPAEYPDYPYHITALSNEEQKRIIDADWKQYSDWLNR